MRHSILICFLIISLFSITILAIEDDNYYNNQDDTDLARYKEFEDYFRADFEAVDTNQDNLITKKEVKDLAEDITDFDVAEFFAKADTNDDGYVNFKEFVLVGIDAYDGIPIEEEEEEESKIDDIIVEEQKELSDDLNINSDL